GEILLALLQPAAIDRGVQTIFRRRRALPRSKVGFRVLEATELETRHPAMDPVERPPRIELDGAIERGKGVLETSLHQQSDTEPDMNLDVHRIVRDGRSVRICCYGVPFSAAQ